MKIVKLEEKTSSNIQSSERTNIQRLNILSFHKKASAWYQNTSSIFFSHSNDTFLKSCIQCNRLAGENEHRLIDIVLVL